ncbi:MAG: PilN domain-containing protein [Cyanophyceae cyanobacterium]
MYSLDVNFLKDRLDESPKPVKKKAATSIGSQVPLVAGAIVMVLLPAIPGAYLWLLNKQKAELEGDIQLIDAEIAQYQAKNQDIETLQQQLSQINAQAEALISVIDQIKSWSAILEDIRDRIPVGVQISSVQQEGSTLSFNGIARSYADVNNFLLALQESQFLTAEQALINGAQTTDSPISIESPAEDEASAATTPNVTFELPDVVSYDITTEINNVPASQLLAELSRKGAAGLVVRIKILERRGAIVQ